MARQIIRQLPGFMIISSPVYQIVQRHIGNTHNCRFPFPIPPMSNTGILEPIDFESEAEENKFKAKWRKIYKYLNQYGLGLQIKITYDESMIEFEMSQEKYTSAVRTSVVRPKLFLKCRPFCIPYWPASQGAAAGGLGRKG